jgi:hypothetical protein
MNFKIPIIGSLVTFALIFIINLIQANAILLSLLRSIISGGLIFGILFGVSFVLTEVLKIDFSSKENTEDDTASEDRKVDVTVDDSIIDETNYDKEYKGGPEHPAEQDEEMSEVPKGDVDFTEDAVEPAEDASDNFNTADMGNNENSFEQQKNSFSSSDDTNDRVRSKLGIDATPEDLVKAIRTTIKRDD